MQRAAPWKYSCFSVSAFVGRDIKSSSLRTIPFPSGNRLRRLPGLRPIVRFETEFSRATRANSTDEGHLGMYLELSLEVLMQTTPFWCRGGFALIELPVAIPWYTDGHSASFTMALDLVIAATASKRPNADPPYAGR